MKGGDCRPLRNADAKLIKYFENCKSQTGEQENMNFNLLLLLFYCQKRTLEARPPATLI